MKVEQVFLSFNFIIIISIQSLLTNFVHLDSVIYTVLYKGPRIDISLGSRPELDGVVSTGTQNRSWSRSNFEV